MRKFLPAVAGTYLDTCPAANDATKAPLVQMQLIVHSNVLQRTIYSTVSSAKNLLRY